MNLVVGNRVTYKDRTDNDKIKTRLILNEDDVKIFKTSPCYKVLKVEACNWETIEFEEE